MANKFQVKRTTVSGRTPNTTNSGNTHFIDTGELALNLTDGKMFSSNGSVSFEIGANLENVRVSTSANLNQVQLANLVVSNTVTINNDKELAFKTLSGAKARLVLQSDDNLVLYNTDTTGSARVVFAMYANSSTSNLQIHAPLQPLSGIVANGTIGSAGQTLTSNGSSIYWAAGAGTGTVTQVDTGNGLTGGPITATGTINVVANNGIVANSSGLFANAGTGVVVNATGIHVNSSYVQNTDSRTLSGNLVISGTYFNPSTNTVLLGNSIQRWVISANTVDTSGLITGGAGATITGQVNASTGFGSGTINATSNGLFANATTISVGNTSVNVTITPSTIDLGTQFDANTTGLYHTGIVNAASHSTSGFVANTTVIAPTSNTILLGNSIGRFVISANTIDTSGLITGGAGATITGQVNATTGFGSGTINATSNGFFANSTTVSLGNSSVNVAIATTGITSSGGTGVNPSSNTVGTALGTTTQRWVINANTGNFSGLVTASAGADVTGQVNASTGFGSGTIGAASNGFFANSTTISLGNTSVNVAITTAGITSSGGTGVNPSSNTVGTALGTTTQRWIINANTGNFTGTVTGTVANMSTSVNSALLTVGTAFLANSTAVNIGNSSVGWFGFGDTSPVATRAFNIRRSWTTDSTAMTSFSNTIVNDTTLTTARGYYSQYNLIYSDTLDANSSGGIQGSDVYGTSTFAINGSTVGGNARINTITGTASEVRNQAGGATANTVDTATGSISKVIQSSSGITTTAYGTRAQIYAANNSITGNVTSAYGISSLIQSNTAMTVGTGYLYHGAYQGSTTTTRYGLYITGEANNYLSGNLTVVGSVNTTSYTVGTNFIANTSGAYHTGTVNAASHTTTGFVANTTAIAPTSNTILLGNSIGRFVLSANTGDFSGTVTGTVANMATSVNSALLTVGTSFIANVTGAYHTGTMNAASHTTSGFVANTTVIAPTSNTILLGNSIGRFVLSANTGDFSGTITGTVANMATSVNSALLTVGTSVIANTSGIVVGNTTSGYISLGDTTPITNRALQIEKDWIIDNSIVTTFSNTLISNTTVTAARSYAGHHTMIINNSQDVNATSVAQNSDSYAHLVYAFNGLTAGGSDARTDGLYGVYSDVRNHASGASANTVTTAVGIQSFVRTYSSGVITSATGVRSIVGAANNSVTGNITTAYGVLANVSSNTAMTIGTGYLFYGVHNGNTTTTKYGVYVSNEANNYFSANVAIGGTATVSAIDVGTSSFIANSTAVVIADPLTANGSTGTSGQVLTSNGTTGSPYWTTVSSGAASASDDTTTNGTRYLLFTNQTSGTILTAYVSSTKLTYNPSTGTLTSTVITSSSDEKLKTNIKTIPNPMLVLNRLRGVSFERVDTGLKDYGVIAQELEQVLPELVHEDRDGYKSVSYSSIIGFLIENSKQQQEKINQLELKIEELINR